MGVIYGKLLFFDQYFGLSSASIKAYLEPFRKYLRQTLVFM